MKITTQIDLATKKRLVKETISAVETELYSALLRNGMDPDSFNSDDFKPSEPETEKETEIQKLIDRLSHLNLRLTELG